MELNIENETRFYTQISLFDKILLTINTIWTIMLWVVILNCD